MLCKGKDLFLPGKEKCHLFLYYLPIFLAKSKYSSYLCRKNL